MLPNIFVVFPVTENHDYRYSFVSSTLTRDEIVCTNRAANVPENSGGSVGHRAASRWVYQLRDVQQW
jgi:hypothetical protein